jgi:flagellar assembly protein FliH
MPPALGDPAHETAAFDGTWMLPELDSSSPSTDVRDPLYESGYADGLRDGVGQAREDLRPALAALAGVAESLNSRRDEMLRDQARNLHGLALAVARKIVQREIATDAGVIEDLVRRALELLPHDLQVDVRLHPEDLQALGDRVDRPTDMSAVTLRWLPDPTMERGGFVVQSPHRLVDGRLDMALRDLYERLESE